MTDKLIIIEGEPSTGKTYLATNYYIDNLDSKQKPIQKLYHQVTLHGILRAKTTSEWLTSIDKCIAKELSETFVIIIDDIDYLRTTNEEINKSIEVFFDVLTLLCNKWMTQRNVLLIILVMAAGLKSFKHFPTMSHPFWQQAKSIRPPELTNTRRCELLRKLVLALNENALDSAEPFLNDCKSLTGLTCADLSQLAQKIVAKETTNSLSLKVNPSSYRVHRFEICTATDLLDEETLTPLLPKHGKAALIGRDKEFDKLTEYLKPDIDQQRPVGILLSGPGTRTLILRVAESLSRPLLFIAAADIFASLVGSSERLLYELSQIMLSNPNVILVMQNLDAWFSSDQTDSSSRRLMKGIGDLFNFCEWNTLPELIDCQRVILATTEFPNQIPSGLMQPHLFKHTINVRPLKEVFAEDPNTLLDFLHLYLDGRASPDLDFEEICNKLSVLQKQMEPSDLISIIQESALQEIAHFITSNPDADSMEKPKISISTKALLGIIRRRQSAIQEASSKAEQPICSNSTHDNNEIAEAEKGA